MIEMSRNGRPHVLHEHTYPIGIALLTYSASTIAKSALADSKRPSPGRQKCPAADSAPSVEPPNGPTEGAEAPKSVACAHLAAMINSYDGHISRTVEVVQP